MAKEQVVQGNTSKMGGFILLLATFFSGLGSGMEWLQTDYTEPVSVNATKTWDAVTSSTGATGSTGAAWADGLVQSTGGEAGKFTLTDRLGNEVGTAQGDNYHSGDNYQLEVDSSLWKYCAPATGGVRTFKVTAGGGGNAVSAADAYEVHQDVFSVNCWVVANMEDGSLKDRLIAAEAFSIMAFFFGSIATLAGFSNQGELMGKVSVQYFAVPACFTALVTICTVSCSSEGMHNDNMCVFPYASLTSNVAEAQYPGLGMICEVFACLFFFIGGITSFIGAKADKTHTVN